MALDSGILPLTIASASVWFEQRSMALKFQDLRADEHARDAQVILVH